MGQMPESFCRQGAFDFLALYRPQCGFWQSCDVGHQHQIDSEALSQLVAVAVFQEQHQLIETRLIYRAAAARKLGIQCQTPRIQLGR